MADRSSQSAARSVAADPAPDAPEPDEMEYVVVSNGSITAEWDTGPWRGKSTSGFTGGGFGDGPSSFRHGPSTY
jgi:hypothetical protein